MKDLVLNRVIFHIQVLKRMNERIISKNQDGLQARGWWFEAGRYTWFRYMAVYLTVYKKCTIHRSVHGHNTRPCIICTAKKMFIEKYTAIVHGRVLVIRLTAKTLKMINSSHTHPWMLTVYPYEKDMFEFLLNISTPYLRHISNPSVMGKDRI